MTVTLSFVLLFIGLLVGLCIHSNNRFGIIITKVMHYIVYILLFFLGISLGGSPELLSNIVQLGKYAFVISVACLVGSLFAAKIVYSLFFKNTTTILKE